jgi:hypothetical protein
MWYLEYPRLFRTRCRANRALLVPAPPATQAPGWQLAGSCGSSPALPATQARAAGARAVNVHGVVIFWFRHPEGMMRLRRHRPSLRS